MADIQEMSLQDIGEYIINMDIKKRRIGGYDRADVFHKMQELYDMFEQYAEKLKKETADVNTTDIYDQVSGVLEEAYKEKERIVRAAGREAEYELLRIRSEIRKEKKEHEIWMEQAVYEKQKLIKSLNRVAERLLETEEQVT